MKLSEITVTLSAIKTSLLEAGDEIVAKLADLEAALADDPAEALAMLEEIRTLAQGLADIVPNAPVEEPVA